MRYSILKPIYKCEIATENYTKTILHVYYMNKNSIKSQEDFAALIATRVFKLSCGFGPLATNPEFIVPALTSSTSAPPAKYGILISTGNGSPK